MTNNYRQCKNMDDQHNIVDEFKYMNTPFAILMTLIMIHIFSNLIREYAKNRNYCNFILQCMFYASCGAVSVAVYRVYPFFAVFLLILCILFKIIWIFKGMTVGDPFIFINPQPDRFRELRRRG